MQIRPLSYEPPSERLLLVELEEIERRYSSDHRHISATVVRRAVSHTRKEDGSVDQYWDDKEAVGYRNATWSTHKESKAIYVDGLRLRGQIDAYGAAGRDPLNKGRPYSNKVEYVCRHVEQSQADAMSKGFAKMEKARASLYTSTRYDDFSEQLFVLSNILGIHTFLFRTSQDSSLATTYFVEQGFPQACVSLNTMLQPFFKG